MQFGGLGELAEQGWTAAEINRVVDAFPDAPYLSLTVLVSQAGDIRLHGASDVDEVIAWLQAMVEPGPGGQLVPRRVVQQETARLLREGHSGVTTVPALWTEAAGSPHNGLAALRAGLTLAETTAHYRPD